MFNPNAWNTNYNNINAVKHDLDWLEKKIDDLQLSKLYPISKL